MEKDRVVNGETYVAGGLALNHLLHRPRVSNAIDVFNGLDAQLAEAIATGEVARLAHDRRVREGDEVKMLFERIDGLDRVVDLAVIEIFSVYCRAARFVGGGKHQCVIEPDLPFLFAGCRVVYQLLCVCDKRI